jgi:segregation and condensation protein B
MEPTVRQALEAILFVIEEPIELTTLCQVLEVGRTEVEAELHRMAEEFEQDHRGFVLREAAGGWRLYTAPAAAAYVERWVLTGRTGRLSQAALETLSVVAYKQPISRHEVSEIRGVNADAALRTLISRDLVDEVGRDPGPGQAILYGTTRSFLERLGLRSLDELPPMTEYLPEGPAPDEPAIGELSQARARLRAGEALPATGRSRWHPDDEAEAAGAGEEMDELSSTLEDVARTAMATLEEAMRAVSGGESDESDSGDAESS